MKKILFILGLVLVLGYGVLAFKGHSELWHVLFFGGCCLFLSWAWDKYDKGGSVA